MKSLEDWFEVLYIFVGQILLEISLKTFKTDLLNLLYDARICLRRLFYESCPKLYLVFGKIGQIMRNYAGFEIFFDLVKPKMTENRPKISSFCTTVVSQVFSSRFQTLLTLIILWKSTCIEARAPFSLYIINIKALLSKKYHEHGYFANWPPPKASPTVVQCDQLLCFCLISCKKNITVWDCEWARIELG